jgi:endonuclease/exonuclease/phosphatase family metal-dependent hydrolase
MAMIGGCPLQANEAAREVQAQQMMERLLAAAQAAMSSQEPDQASASNGAESGDAQALRPLVVLCGDFNDSPGSAACQVLPCSPSHDNLSHVTRRCAV